MTAVPARNGTRQRVLDFIVEFRSEHGYSPTILEICRGLDLASKSTVWNHLNHLRREGRVTWQEGSDRTVRPT